MPPSADNRDQDGLPKSGKTESDIGYTQDKMADNYMSSLNWVTWSKDDPENPKNWPTRAKWAITLLVSGFTFITPVSSSMVAPALTSIAKELSVTTDFEVQLILSIFLLAYAVGPLFFAPLSEHIGRRHVLLWSNVFYFAWNLGCGFARNEAEILTFRFLSGIGGSAPLALGAGVLSDIWEPEQRGKAVAIWGLGPLLGPVVGPIAGGFIAERTTWRWVFWSTSGVAGVIGLLGFVFLRESHHPTLLKIKCHKLRESTGNTLLHVECEENKSSHSKFSHAIIRPCRLILTQPIIQIVSLYVAYLFGLFYLLLSTFPSVWEDVYGESTGISGLNYIALGIGSFVGIFAYVQVCDRLYARLKKINNNVGRAEFRVPLMYAGSLFVPVGLFWYGWSVQYKLHWVMPNFGVIIYSAGMMLCLQPMQSYVIDAYSTFAASGLAAVVVLRSLCEFAFPLFAPYLYKSLGYGWGNSLLGFISIVLGIPLPFVFWYFGGSLRSLSRYAAG